jgi:GTPase
LGLSDAPSHARLKDLLLGTATEAENSLQLLAGIIQARIDEGQGETLFDLGQEDNGESMGFDIAQWNTAFTRLREAAETILHTAVSY